MENEKFYSDLASYYHLIYQDWEQSIKTQGTMLHTAIQEYFRSPIKTIADVSCGIGTQSIGLAQRDYQVSGTDLSTNGIARAQKETAARKLNVPLSVCDMRAVSGHYKSKFDLILSCDNSVPHLLTDEEILHAFKEFYKLAVATGGCLISVRDYEKEERSGVQHKLYGTRQENGKEYTLIQKWRFTDRERYNLKFYVIEESSGVDPITHVFETTYYAVSLKKLKELLSVAGFVDIEIEYDKFFQPLLLGRKP